MGLHPADIISGYTKAYRKCLELIESPDLVIDRIEGKEIESKDRIIKAILAPMASKQYGYESFLAPLVAEACLAVMPKNAFNFQGASTTSRGNNAQTRARTRSVMCAMFFFSLFV